MFEVNDDQAEKALKRIAMAFDHLRAEGQKPLVDSHAIQEMSSHLSEFGERLTGYGERGLHMMEGMGEAIVHNAQHFEELARRVEFAYGGAGAEADAAYARIQQFAVDSVYSLSSITTAAVSLRTAFNGIDLSADQDRFLARNGQMVTALEAFSDAAMGSEQSLSDVLRQVEGALSGQFRSLQTLRLNHHEIDQIRQGIAGATTAQEKMNRIAAVLAAHYGGAQAALSTTFKFAMDQIPDVIEQLYAGIGRAGLPILTKGVNDFIDLLKEILRDQALMTALSDTFILVAHALTLGAKGMMWLVRGVVALIKFAPALPKFAAVMLLIGSTLLIIVGNIVAFAGTIMAAQAAFAALSATMIELAPVVLAIMAAFIAISVVLVGLFAVVSRVWQRDLGGIRTFFERVRLVVVGLVEAFQNWSEGTTRISMETANALAEAGVMEFFLDLIVHAGRAEKWLKAFWKGLQDGYAKIAPDLERAGHAIDLLFRTIGEAFGTLSGVINTDGVRIKASWGEVERNGTGMANTIMGVVIPAVRAVTAVITFFSDILRNYVVPAGVMLINQWLTFQKEHGQLVEGIKTFGKIIAFVFGVVLLNFVMMGVGLFGAIGVAVGAVISVLGVIGAVINTVTNAFSRFFQYLRETVPFVDAIARGFSAIGSSIGNYFNAANEDPSANGRPVTAVTGFGDGATSSTIVNAPTEDGAGKLQGDNIGRARDRGFASVAEYLDATTANGGAGGAGGKVDVAGGARQHRADARAMERGDKTLEQIRVLMEAQNAAIKSGALRPVIEGEQIAGAQRGADEDAGHRLGQR